MTIHISYCYKCQVYIKSKQLNDKIAHAYSRKSTLIFLIVSTSEFWHFSNDSSFNLQSPYSMLNDRKTMRHKLATISHWLWKNTCYIDSFAYHKNRIQ